MQIPCRKDDFGHQGGPRPRHGADHVVQFHESEDFLVRAVTDFLAQGLRSGQPVLVIATPERREAVADRLSSLGFDPGRAAAGGLPHFCDARETLAEFMVGALPDPERFRLRVGASVAESHGDRPGVRVRIYEEMVDVLWRDGNAEAALRLEELWNDLERTHDFSLLCTCAMGNFRRRSDAHRLEEVCVRHSAVIPAEGYTLAADEVARSLEVLRLQQKALALESEVRLRSELERTLLQALEDRRRAEEEMRRNEGNIRDFLENALEGLHWVGPGGTILWANRAEVEMLGYPPGEYIGRPLRDFYLEPRVADRLLARLHAGETVRDFETTLRCRDGSLRHVIVDANVLWQGDTFVHTRGFTRDITEWKATQEDLTRAKDEAERANRVKSEFMAVMSHELRTPLNAIIGYGELLRHGVGGPLNGEQSGYLDRIRASAEQLLGLIEQVLNLTRGEAGEHDVLSVPFDLVATTREAVALLEPDARRKGIRLELRTPEALACRTDHGKLRQILLNLLSNAVKFTADGTIEVEVATLEGAARVQVTDTGPGIDGRDLGRIFEPFVQLDASTTRRHGGTGLGLFVSRDLARLLGGDITVTSAPGQGSTFSVRFPLEWSEGLRTAEGAAGMGHESAAGKGHPGAAGNDGNGKLSLPATVD